MRKNKVWSKNIKMENVSKMPKEEMDSISKNDKFQKIKSDLDNYNCVSHNGIVESPCDRDHIKAAVNFLSKRALSEKELEYKLKKKFGNLDFSKVVLKMKSLNFINDDELAKFELEKMSGRKLYSNSRIRSHMNFKGLKSEILEFPDNEKERALNLLKKKYRIKSEKNKNRASRLLFSYGYPSNVVRECVNEYFCEFS